MGRAGHPGVEQLCRLVGRDAVSCRDVDWSTTQAQYGVPLPADFRAYASVFATGVHFDVVTVPTPALRADGSGMPEDIVEILEIVRHPSRTYENAWAEPVPPACLLPWGYIGVDDVFCWAVTQADPDRWPVVVCTFELTDQFLFDGGMVEFLTAFAERAVCPPGLDHVLANPRTFTPIRFGPADPNRPTVVVRGAS